MFLFLYNPKLNFKKLAEIMPTENFKAVEDALYNSILYNYNRKYIYFPFTKEFDDVQLALKILGFQIENNIIKWNDLNFDISRDF